MKKIEKWDKKYFHWGITAFCVIAASILFYMALNYLGSLSDALKSFGKILSPFIWGFAITYLVCPTMKRLESRVFSRLFEKLFAKLPARWKKKRRSFERGFAVFTVELILLALIVAFMYMIIPQIYASLETIVTNGDAYFAKLSEWVRELLTGFPTVERYVMSALDKVGDNMIEWLRSTLLPELGNVVTNLTSGVYYAMKTVYNLLIGIIVSIYILADIEGFSARILRFAYSIMSPETVQNLRGMLAFADRTFAGFINGKLLDSAIIAVICYLFCIIAKMPYALLISVIVGVTNIIPFFGPFIGAIPSALIILMTEPVKCVGFVIFIIILQQIDGNLIGPKILGSTTGISGFWVMFSIIIGAGLFGFWGMLLGVPVFVVIYAALNKGIEKRLTRSGLPTEETDYSDLDYIDPTTHKAVRRGEK